MDEAEFDLRSIYGLLRRQFRLIIITMAVVVGIAATIAFTLTPVYTSSALILVDPSSKNLLDPEAQMTSSSADSARIDSEVELVRSDSVLLDVIREKNLLSDEEFGVSIGLWPRVLAFFRLAEPALPSGEEALNQALAQLRSSVTVQRRGLTYLISVSVHSESRAKAAELANAVTEAYIADQLASKVNSTLASRDILQSRIDQAREAIASSENSYDSFIRENLDRIAADAGRTDLTSMQSQISQLEAARANTSALASTVQTALGSNDLDTVVASLQSEALTELERQRDELQQNVANAAAGSPAAVNLQQELAAIEDTIRDQATSEIQGLRATVQRDQEQADVLRQNLRTEVLNSSLSADVLTQLYELQQSAELARTQYQTLLRRANDLEAQADLQLADSRIVSPALPPRSPSFPNKTLILAIAAIAALGLGIGLAFLYENLFGGFVSEEQVEAVLRTPVAASVPRQRAKSERDSLANLMVTAPLSVFAEAVRRARVSLEQALRKVGPGGAEPTSKVIMVTSTSPNEGKTTMSLSLARSYALSGQRTLLIDCDLRKPSIHRHLNMEPSTGLIDFLASGPDAQDTIGSVVTTDSITPVTIIVGSRRSDLPTDQLLAGPSFGRLMAAARNSFDVIVLDTPPIGPVVDGLYIAPYVDAILFVTRWASTWQGDARKSVISLTAAKSPDAPLITVLNQQDESRGSYQRKYGSYYSYTT